MEESFANQRGMTLIEIMIAVAIIGVGLLALARVIPLAAYGIHEGNHLSTATFLANQRLEQMRNARWEEGSPPCVAGAVQPATKVDELGVSATATAPPISSCPGGVVIPNLGDENQVANPLPPAYNDAPPTFKDAYAGAYLSYSRTARVISCGVGAGCNGIVDANLRQVTVTVTYRPMTGIGLSAPGTTKAATVTMYVARR